MRWVALSVVGVCVCVCMFVFLVPVRARAWVTVFNLVAHPATIDAADGRAAIIMLKIVALLTVLAASVAGAGFRGSSLLAASTGDKTSWWERKRKLLLNLVL